MEPEAIPLPEPYARMPQYVADPANPYCANAVILNSVDVYSADQVRAVVLAERERCARVCEEHARITWDDEEGALACAAAIRSGTAPAQEV